MSLSKFAASYNTVAGQKHHILTLPNGRQLAYARNGPTDARTVVIFFAGLMSVGNAGHVPDPCQERGMQWIGPTLPGMGQTSTRDKSEPYNVGLARDMTALLKHLYPTDAYDALYIAGGSYGTVHAQMLYGAPYDIFPAGRKIVACMAGAGFAPFKYYTNYTKTLTWANWFSVGPLAYYIPFHLMQRGMSSLMSSRIKTPEAGAKLFESLLFSRMDDGEKAAMAKLLEKRGQTREELLGELGKGACESSKNWDGFHEVAQVLHSDWGFDPAKLDDEHAEKPLLVVSSSEDHMGGSTNEWMARTYRSATHKVIPGSHISALFYMDEIFSDVIKLAEGQ